MWNKPWNMKEGFVIGAGLIVAGLLLELTVGPVVWDAFAWPANGLVLVGFVAMIVAMHLLRRRVYAFRFLSTYHAAIPAMCYAVVLTIIMGRPFLASPAKNSLAIRCSSWFSRKLSICPCMSSTLCQQEVSSLAEHQPALTALSLS
jgi:hypothetical protein